jgi:hypothetical protein
MTQPIFNNLSSSDLNVIVVQDVERIKLYRESVAKQINRHRMKQAQPKEILDLSDFIADIIIETTVQGSSLLEVHIIDPGWITLRRDSNGTSFFDVDDSGYLWPPIDLNFPPDVSDAQWRLCQLRPSTDTTQANVILTFEDKVVATMREFSGPVMSSVNQTRAEFIRQLVKEATVGGKLPPSTLGGSLPKQVTPTTGTADGSIRFVSLLPNSDFTSADLNADELSLPASAKQPGAPPARQNPNKKAGLPTNIPGGAPGSTRPPGPSGLSHAVTNGGDQALNGTSLNISDGLSVPPGIASSPFSPILPASQAPSGSAFTGLS